MKKISKDSPAADEAGAFKSLARGSSVVLASLMLSKVITGLNTWVIARASPELLGEFAVGSAFLALAFLPELGFPAGLVRLIPEYAFKRDLKKVKELAGVALKASFVSSLIFCVALFAASDWIAARFFVSYTSMAVVLKVFAFGIFFLSFVEVLAAIMHGFKRVELEAYLRSLAENLLRLGAVVAAVFFGFGVVGLSLAYVAAELVAAVFGLWLVNRYVLPLKQVFSSANLKGAVAGRLFYFSAPILFAQTFATALGAAGTLFLGHFRTPVETGIYAAASALVMLTLLAPSVIANLSLQVMVEQHAQGNRKTVEKIYASVCKWIFFANLPLVLFFSIFASRIMEIFGSEFSAGAQTLVVLSAGYLVYSVGMPAVNALSVFDKPRLVLVNSIAAALSAVLLCFLLVPTYGMFGAGFAYVFALSLSVIMAQIEIFFLQKMQPYSFEFVKASVAACVALGLAYFGFRLADQYYLLALVLAAAVAAVLYTAFLFFLRAFDEKDILLLKVAERKFGVAKLAPLRELAKKYYFRK